MSTSKWSYPILYPLKAPIRSIANSITPIPPHLFNPLFPLWTLLLYAPFQNISLNPAAFRMFRRAQFIHFIKCTHFTHTKNAKLVCITKKKGIEEISGARISHDALPLQEEKKRTFVSCQMLYVTSIFCLIIYHLSNFVHSTH